MPDQCASVHIGTLATALAFSLDDSQLAVGLQDGTVDIIDVRSGDTIAVLNNASVYWDSRVRWLGFLKDQPHLLVSMSSRRIVLWDVAKAIEHHRENPGKLLRDQYAKAPPYQVKVLLNSTDDTINCAALSADGTRLLVACVDGILAWSTSDWKSTPIACGRRYSHLHWLAFVNGDAALVAADHRDDVYVWEFANVSKSIQAFGEHTDWVMCVAARPKSSRFITTSCDNTAKLWDVSADGYDVVHSLEGHTDPVYSAAYTPDGERVVTGSSNGNLKIWSTATGKLLGDMHDPHSKGVFELAVSNSGTLVAAACGSMGVHIWPL